METCQTTVDELIAQYSQSCLKELRHEDLSPSSPILTCLESILREYPLSIGKIYLYWISTPRWFLRVYDDAYPPYGYVNPSLPFEPSNLDPLLTIPLKDLQPTLNQCISHQIQVEPITAYSPLRYSFYVKARIGVEQLIYLAKTYD
jgi:hypothetical protein